MSFFEKVNINSPVLGNIDFSTYKFRPSKIGLLMSKSNSITEKQLETLNELETKKVLFDNNQLSTRQKWTNKNEEELKKLKINKKNSEDLSILPESVKTHLNDIFVEAYYGRKKIISTKATRKGLLQEASSIELLNKFLFKKFNKETHYVKNIEVFSNDYIIGTPDIVTDKVVIDIKTPVDIFSFRNKNGISKLYEYQLQAYMWLTGKQKASLVFCLSNSPQKMLEKALEFAEDTEEMENIFKLHVYDDIDINYKIKMFETQYNEKIIEEFKIRIESSRNYLQYLAQKENLLKEIF